MGAEVPVEALEPARFWAERRAAFKVRRCLTVPTRVACGAGGRDAGQRNPKAMLGGVRLRPAGQGGQSLLFDHAVRPLLQLRRDIQAQRFCCLEVDHEIIFGWRLNRQVARLFTL